MFKTAALISTAALAVATIASPAMAQSFYPRSSSATLTGTLNLEQTQNIDCVTTIGLSINASGAATVTSRSFSPGDWFYCGFIVQPLGTWTVTAGSQINSDEHNVTASVGAQSIAGTCFGSVAGVYKNSTKTLTITNQTIPSTDPSDCYVDGALVANTSVSIQTP
jgi:hypothetical protein